MGRRARRRTSSTIRPRVVLLVLVALLIAGTGAVTAPAAGARTDGPIPEGGMPVLSWRTVNASGVGNCAILSVRSLHCWGDDTFGQIGNGPPLTMEPDFVLATPGTGWTSISGGGTHVCGIVTPGRLYCWGSDSSNQLGNGATNAPSSVPVQVGTASDWKQVSAGGQHTCGIRANRRLYCWGNILPAGRGTPGAVGTAADWQTVSAGFSNTTCGIRANRRLYCWGSDLLGELGNGGANLDRATPTQVALGFTNWATVSVGNRHVCATRANNTAWCWGDDSRGQLGNGTLLAGSANKPTIVAGAGGWTRVSAGVNFTCGLAGNSGRCWGADEYGQLGNGDTRTGDKHVPSSNIGTFLNLDVGQAHGCGVNGSGQIACWGTDSSGQLGNGDDEVGGRTSPEEIDGQ